MQITFIKHIACNSHVRRSVLLLWRSSVLYPGSTLILQQKNQPHRGCDLLWVINLAALSTTMPAFHFPQKENGQRDVQVLNFCFYWLYCIFLFGGYNFNTKKITHISKSYKSGRKGVCSLSLAVCVYIGWLCLFY